MSLSLVTKMRAENRPVHEEARGLVLAGTLFASLMLFAISGSAQTLEWGELGVVGGTVGGLLSLYPYMRLLTRLSAVPPGGAAASAFWVIIGFLVLFFFWFSAALALNTAWSWSAPIARVEGIVTGKRISSGRYSNSYMLDIDSPRGTFATMTPKDIWEDVATGQQLRLTVCAGALGYPYVVTPLDMGPFIDIKRLLGLRDPSVEAEC
jgi:hypothetical protein